MLRFLSNLPIIRSFVSNDCQPSHVTFRNNTSDVAIVFIHGFSGHSTGTWHSMIDLLMIEPLVSSWDVFSLHYPTALRIDIPRVWTADPDLDILASNLRTAMSHAPFNRYKRLAIVAHSMGGLVAQKAIVDDARLSKRVSHLILFATPSKGIGKAQPFARLKRQFRDMDPQGVFIKTLRRDWDTKFGSTRPFELRVVAGNKDEFVPPHSSIGPFPNDVQEVVPGDHLGIVRPQTLEDPNIQVVIGALCYRSTARGVIDSAEVAVELGNFQDAVEMLLPYVDAIDDLAVINLALALGGLGREDDALAVLERRHGQNNFDLSDALGTLGGRLKRRWLISRNADDLAASKKHYSEALLISEKNGDDEQAAYQCINLAFLTLLSSPPDAAMPDNVKALANKALKHALCGRQDNNWMLATQGEAALVLDSLEAGIDCYCRALAITTSPRQIDSMYSQAVRVATRMYGQPGADSFQALFGFSYKS